MFSFTTSAARPAVAAILRPFFAFTTHSTLTRSVVLSSASSGDDRLIGATFQFAKFFTLFPGFQ